jgi:hypothetical protein
MIEITGKKEAWEDSEDKLFPTIDFFDQLTITNYGKLRKILLNFGKNYHDRLKSVYNFVFALMII